MHVLGWYFRVFIRFALFRVLTADISFFQLRGFPFIPSASRHC